MCWEIEHAGHDVGCVKPDDGHAGQARAGHNHGEAEGHSVGSCQPEPSPPVHALNESLAVGLSHDAGLNSEGRRS